MAQLRFLMSLTSGPILSHFFAGLFLLLCSSFLLHDTTVASALFHSCDCALLRLCTNLCSSFSALNPSDQNLYQIFYEGRFWQSRCTARPFPARLVHSLSKSGAKPYSRAVVLPATTVIRAKPPFAAGYTVSACPVMESAARSLSTHQKLKASAKASRIRTLSLQSMRRPKR